MSDQEELIGRGRPAEFPFRDMEVGQSFWMEDREDFKRARNAAHTFGSINSGFRFETNIKELRITRVKSSKQETGNSALNANEEE